MTNKRNAAKDISKLEGQQRLAKDLHAKLDKDGDALPKTTPDAHYHMAQSKKNVIHIPSWLNTHMDDIALAVSRFQLPK